MQFNVGLPTRESITRQRRRTVWSRMAWSNDRIASEGVLVGYSPESPDYRVWDPETRNVYNIGGPAFNEETGPGWWKKDPTILLLTPDDEEEDLEFNDED